MKTQNSPKCIKVKQIVSFSSFPRNNNIMEDYSMITAITHVYLEFKRGRSVGSILSTRSVLEKFFRIAGSDENGSEQRLHLEGRSGQDL